MEMADITAATAGSTLLSSNMAHTAAQQAEADSNATAVTAEGLSATGIDALKFETVEISTRAQNIHKLNDEFFSSDPRAFKVSSAFINRLKEYGLISSSEAEKLGGSSGLTNSINDGAKTIDELSTFIESFKGTVEEITPDSSLIDILQQAQTVLDNFNAPTESSLDINITSIIERLKNYNDTSTDSLPEADKKSLDQLILALDIANVLKPGTNTTAEIDRYLAIGKL